MKAIVTHFHADFDALGAVVAAHLLEPAAHAVIDTGNPAVEAFLALHREALGIRRTGQIDWTGVDELVVVDVQDPARLDGVPAEVVQRVIWRFVDHHPPIARPEGVGQIEAVGAATTLLVEPLKKRGAVPDALQATVMALGIYVDTGGLLLPTTTARDAAAYAWLLEAGARTQIVRQYSQAHLPEALQTVLENLLAGSRPIRIGGHPGIASVVTCPVNTPDAAGAVTAWTAIVGKPITVAALQMAHTVHLIVRSAVPGLDLVAALAPLGARGHTGACHAKIRKLSAEAVVAEALGLLERAVPMALQARRIMTAPVASIPPETPVQDALGLLAAWGYGTLPVAGDDGVPVGIVSRAELDKAIRHGLAHSPVTGVMRRPTVIAADTSQDDLPGLLTRATLQRLLVVEEGILAGIISGRDLVRHLYPAAPAPAELPDAGTLAARVRDWAGEPVLAVLRQAGVLAAAQDVALYWVGGSVRDLLLGRTAPPDVDLVVDGDGAAFARAWADLTGAGVTVHEQFGTAMLQTAAGPVDVATSRREIYTHPGAQPEVAASPLVHDLARRDFTVNALAIRLDPPHFGQILDFFGGWQDLRQRRLAVLHPLSFLEDPSRVWRAVRFEKALGFRLVPEDEHRARDAFARDALQGHFNHRIAKEMRLLWSREDDMADSLDRLADLKALDGFGVTVSPAMIDQFRRFERAASELGLARSERWLGGLVLLLAGLSAQRRNAVLVGLKLGEADRDRLRRCWGLMPRPVPTTDVALYDWGHGESALAMACRLAVAETDEEPAIRRFWEVVRPIRLVITGADLEAMGYRPGPLFGKVLTAVHRAKLAGEIGSEDDERRLAAQLAALEDGCSTT